MVDRTKNRSNIYQNLFVESACSPEMLAEFSLTDSIQARLNPFGYNEELFELKEKLRLAFWRIVDTQLTERQREVLKLYAEGYTQIEIAKKLGVNQSSITKSINGNCDYKSSGGKRIYGGAKKRIQKLASKDPEIIEILSRIADLQSDEY